MTAAVGSGGNAVDANFGLYNVLGTGMVGDVTYAHVLTWLPTTTYSSAVLRILAYGSEGSNDAVIADDVALGNLVSQGGPTSVITTSSFNIVLSYLADGVVAITINKSNNDVLNVFNSRLTVEYDDGIGAEALEALDAVPEPASLLLLGTGLVGLVAYRRRLARR